MIQNQKTILIWGAGRIGRGFVGDIFASAGYHLVFVDQAKSLVEKLNQRESYTVVKAINEKNISFSKIENFKAFHTSQKQEIQKIINKIDTIAIATFPKNFGSVARTLQPLIINRKQTNPDNPINILICTNLVHAGPLFQQHLLTGLEKTEFEYFSEKVGIVETLIIRIAPPAPQEEIKKDPLVVWTNGYSEFPVAKSDFKGTPPEIPNFRFVQDMRAEEKRKIYTYNMCHAILGYYGFQLGYDLLVECLDDHFIRREVEGALDEASKALQREYAFSENKMTNWIHGVIEQTDNSTIGDSVIRMAADPIRKLKRDDRLVGPALLSLQNGINPSHIINAIGAAFHYNNENDPASVKISNQIKTDGLKKTIHHICELGKGGIENILVEKIEESYNQFELELAWHKKSLQAFELGFKYEKIYHGCGQCVYAAVAEILDIFDPEVFNAATGLCGGIGLMNDATCSAFSGGVLVIGQLFPRHRKNFSGDKKSKYANFDLVQLLRKRFENEFGTIKCAEVHKKKYGKSYDLQLKSERLAFEAAGGHGEMGCTDTVGKAAQFTIEVIAPYMITKEKEKYGKRS